MYPNFRTWHLFENVLFKFLRLIFFENIVFNNRRIQNTIIFLCSVKNFMVIFFSKILQYIMYIVTKPLKNFIYLLLYWKLYFFNFLTKCAPKIQLKRNSPSLLLFHLKNSSLCSLINSALKWPCIIFISTTLTPPLTNVAQNTKFRKRRNFCRQLGFCRKIFHL